MSHSKSLKVGDREFRIGAHYHYQQGKRPVEQRVFLGPSVVKGWVRYKGPMGNAIISEKGWARWAGEEITTLDQIKFDLANAECDEADAKRRLQEATERMQGLRRKLQEFVDG